jgi:hypothetical protein
MGRAADRRCHLVSTFFLFTSGAERSRAEQSGVEKFHFLQRIGKELFIHLNWSVLTWVRRLEEEELKVEKVKQIFFFF